MFTWRITKYNPAYRDESGIYKICEWTSFHDIGKSICGKTLTVNGYILIENAYVNAILSFMDSSAIASLTVKDLEKHNKSSNLDKKSELYSKEMLKLFTVLEDNTALSKNEIPYLSRLVLRENVWCKLEEKHKMFVHFGYDYYMYIGSHKLCEDAINKITKAGLFVEEFESPYNC
jgi:hypothetical protein